jgi:hypothetical protein
MIAQYTAVHVANHSGGPGGRCSSSCALLFISGIERLVPNDIFGSSIGFHEPSTRLRDGTLLCQSKDSLAAMAMQAYARSMLSSDAAIYFMDSVFSARCDSINKIDSKILLRNSIATGSY